MLSTCILSNLCFLVNIWSQASPASKDGDLYRFTSKTVSCAKTLESIREGSEDLNTWTCPIKMRFRCVTRPVTRGKIDYPHPPPIPQHQHSIYPTPISGPFRRWRHPFYVVFGQWRPWNFWTCTFCSSTCGSFLPSRRGIFMRDLLCVLMETANMGGVW